MVNGIKNIVRALQPNKTMVKDLRDFNGKNANETMSIMHDVFNAQVDLGDYIYATNDENAKKTYMELIKSLAKLQHKVTDYIYKLNNTVSKTE